MKSTQELHARIAEAPYTVVDVGSQCRPLVKFANRSQFPSGTFWMCIDVDPRYYGTRSNVPRGSKYVWHREHTIPTNGPPEWNLRRTSVDEIYFGNVLGEPNELSGNSPISKANALCYAWSRLRPGGILTIFEDLTPYLPESQALLTSLGIAYQTTLRDDSADWQSLIERYQSNYRDYPQNILDRVKWHNDPEASIGAFFLRAIR